MNKRLADAIGKTRLYHAYNRAFGKFDYRSIDFFIHAYSRAHRDVHFIQVGGNDGITWDPLHYFVRRDHWRGVVIEPQREVFEQRLKVTYQHIPRVQLMNVAVDLTDGVRPLFKYSFTTSRYATGAASLDKDMLIAAFKSDFIQTNVRRENLTLGDNAEDYITSEPVTCVSFDTLLRTLNWQTVDFLCTDAEGHDIRILDAFPLDRLRPANILFELPRRFDAQFAAFLAKLRTHDYDVHLSKGDCIALRRD
jgi:FkbM family methyltransferase